jgi:uncharacterized protein
VNRLIAIVGLIWCCCASAAEVMPASPERYFNDYAGVISPGTADGLNRKLENFERDTSSQIVVAIFPKMQTDSSIEDYCLRIYRSWKVGQKDKNNGAVLFVFVQDHRMNITTGYGLEGALPDSICKRIIDQEIAPRFKQGDFDGGVTAGVNAILAATKGEYKGSGQTVGGKIAAVHGEILRWLFWAFIILVFYLISRRGNRGGGWVFFGGGGGWSGGGGGGGWSGGGGGGFSGGGGSSGGGGASGSW